MTTIDPATRWFEIKVIPDKREDNHSNQLEKTWLCRYPWPQKVICDREIEFMAELKAMLQQDYGCKINQITIKTQADTILERICQTIGNMITTFQILSNKNLMKKIHSVVY